MFPPLAGFELLEHPMRLPFKAALEFEPYTWHTSGEWEWQEKVNAYFAEHPPWYDPRELEELGAYGTAPLDRP